MSARVTLAAVAALAILSVLSVAATRPAFAAPPETQSFEFAIVNENLGSCGSFNVIANGRGSATETLYFDNQGAPVRIQFRGRFSGTLTNSVTGASITDSPSVANIFVDLAKGTATFIGTFFNITVPGKGAVVLEAGRLVVDAGGEVTFVAGPHLRDGFATLCAALA